MKKYVNPALTTEEISVEDVITVDYTVDGEGEEITWSDLWTSAMNKQYFTKLCSENCRAFFRI